MFIEDILGSESKIKILRTLCDTNSAFSLENLEGETKLSRGILHREVKRLLNNKIIISIKQAGKLRYYRLNLDNEYVSFIIKLFETEKIKERKNKIFLPTWNLLHILAKDISLEYKNKLLSLVLFGSTARGTASIYSDIDLLAVVANDVKQDKLYGIVNKTQKKIKNKINLVILKESEFLDAQKQKTTFILEINKDGIDLYNYLIDNARKLLEPKDSAKIKIKGR